MAITFFLIFRNSLIDFSLFEDGGTFGPCGRIKFFDEWNNEFMKSGIANMAISNERRVFCICRTFKGILDFLYIPDFKGIPDFLYSLVFRGKLGAYKAFVSKQSILLQISFNEFILDFTKHLPFCFQFALYTLPINPPPISFNSLYL
uniref:Uncharacterized protein n=1 Tax=Rhizophagus irregularis (strain DAOM 181602 / DAOM 197198 / MUCL 43194) TaxID=747089 RepID=U9UNH7_RHIID